MKKLLSFLYEFFNTAFWGMLLFGCFLNTKCIIHIIKVYKNKYDYKKVEVKIVGFENSSMGDGGNVVFSFGYYKDKKVKIHGQLSYGSIYTVWIDSMNYSTELANSKNETLVQLNKRLVKGDVKFIIIYSVLVLLIFICKISVKKFIKRYDVENE